MLGDELILALPLSQVYGVFPDVRSFCKVCCSGQVGKFCQARQQDLNNAIYVQKNRKFQYESTVLVAFHPVKVLNTNITSNSAFTYRLRNSFQYFLAIAISVTERSL